MKKTVPALLLAALLLCACAVPTGWVTEADGSRAYYDEQGLPLTGLQELQGRTYYFDSQGRMRTGWQELEGKRYYFDPDGSMHTGPLTAGDGRRYYLLEDGTLFTGWLSSGDRQFYYGPDGAMTLGWAQVDGQARYFLPDGALATGRTRIDGTEYLFDCVGLPVTGWQSAQGTPFYTLADGAIATGWQEVEGKRYYFGPDGLMRTGRVTLDDGTYILEADGTPRTGWFQEGDYRYYCHSSGRLAVGRTELEGQVFYFSPHGVNILLVNPWNPLPQDYTTTFEFVTGYPVASVMAEPLRQMLADCRAQGLLPVVCSSYRTQTDQEYLYNNKVARVMAEEGLPRQEAEVIAAQVVAVPGTSEHQLGLAVDIVDNDNWQLDESQADMPAQKWLMEHCWEYGFILRYPVEASDLTGIIYEPWHYRYVGVDIALELRDLGITLEEYLGAAQHAE